MMGFNLWQHRYSHLMAFALVRPLFHPRHEARHPPCCIRPHSFPWSKGRSTSRTAFPLLVLHRHRFPGSKGRSSAPTQVAFHHELWSLVSSLLLLLLLLLLLPSPAAAVSAAAIAMLQPAAVVSGSLVAAVADLHRKHGTGIKGVGRRPPLVADIAYPAVTSGPSC